MNKKQIKQCLVRSMEEQFDKIKGFENNQKKEEIKMKNNFRKVILPLTLAAAMSFCLFLGITMFINNKPETLVALDVNPAIEMELNNKEKVVKIAGKNEDAKKILGDMNLKNVDADVAVNALVGSMLKNGYLKENSNDNNILLTVSNEDTVKSKEIKEKLTKSIKETLNTNNSKANILLQEDKITEEDKKIAEDFNISVGRAKFINKLVEKVPELSKEELSRMTIKEMVAYLNEKNIDFDDIVENDDDIFDDLLDQEEDMIEEKQEKAKEEQEKAEELKEEEEERAKEEQEKAEELREKEEERAKEEQEKAEELKEKEEERAKEEQEKAEELKEEEEEKANEE